MNYIKEIVAFYDRQIQQPLSGSAISLWHALMHINNKTRWKKEFTAAGTYLRFISGLTESSFKRARNELVNLGYIEYESNGRGKSPKYKMISFVAELEQPEYVEEIDIQPMTLLEQNNGPTHDPNPAELSNDVSTELDQAYNSSSREPDDLKSLLQQRSHQASDLYIKEQTESVANLIEERTTAVDQSDQPKNDTTAELADQLPNHTPNHTPNHHPAPIYKQNINKINTKQNKTAVAVLADERKENFADQKLVNRRTEPDAAAFYQQNFGSISSFVMKSLHEWTKALGDELVIEAMKRALKRNITSWAYIKSILTAWLKKGVFTIEQAQEEQLAFENRKRERFEIEEGVRDYKQNFGIEKQQISVEQSSAMEELRREKEKFLQWRKEQHHVV